MKKISYQDKKFIFLLFLVCVLKLHISEGEFLLIFDMMAVGLDPDSL